MASDGKTYLGMSSQGLTHRLRTCSDNLRNSSKFWLSLWRLTSSSGDSTKFICLPKSSLWLAHWEYKSRCLCWSLRAASGSYACWWKYPGPCWYVTCCRGTAVAFWRCEAGSTIVGEALRLRPPALLWPEVSPARTGLAVAEAASSL